MEMNYELHEIVENIRNAASQLGKFIEANEKELSQDEFIHLMQAEANTNRAANSIWHMKYADYRARASYTMENGVSKEHYRFTDF